MMITYRKYIDSDFQQIKNLAAQYNIELPSYGDCYIAEEFGKIIGFTIIRSVPIIEPFVCTNPLAGKKLYDLLLNENTFPVIRCNIDSENIFLLERLGFKEVFKDKIQMEKIK